MKLETDWKHTKESKKIFLGDQVNRTAPQAKSKPNPLPSAKPNPTPLNTTLMNQIKRSNAELTKRNAELLSLLEEERRKYDGLFEEYEELIEKNSLIERQYINLKYEHNREIKQQKKQIIEQADLYLGQCLADFSREIHGEVLWEGIRNKIEHFVMNVKRTVEALQYSKVKKDKSSVIKQVKLKDSHMNHLSKSAVQSPSKTSQQQEFHPSPHKSTHFAKQKSLMVPSPVKSFQGDKSVRSSRDTDVMANNQVQSCRTSRQVEEPEHQFQDEYFGQLQDFPAYEEKIQLRRNYELMKNVSKGNGDGRRKRIFNPNAQ